MSQELTPVFNPETGVKGVSPTITTTTVVPRVNLLTEQYKTSRGLFETETQWNPVGRPIYRRLPAVGEAYQVDFFADEEIGYVYIPLGRDQFGPGSIFAETSEDKTALLVYNGTIVWSSGTTDVLKAIIDFRQIDLADGRYLLCYQRIYNDDPQPLPFEVTDYSLAGEDFIINDSASASLDVAGQPNGHPWPYPGQYAFLNQNPKLNWKNFTAVNNANPATEFAIIPGFAASTQPLNAWITWQSPYPWKLDKIVMRCPFELNQTATLQYFDLEENDWRNIQASPPVFDGNGETTWTFLTNTDPQTRWRVEWPFETLVEISSIEVSGLIVKVSRPSVPTTRAQLAIYPTNLIPKDEVLCNICIFSVDNFEVTRKEDIRNIATRDFEPVANWLTQYWDANLIQDWEKTRTYAPGFMAPPTLLREDYYGLDEYGIFVNPDDPPLPPEPPAPTEVMLIGASVLLYPPITSSIISASVIIGEPPEPAPQITNIVGRVEP